MKLRYYNILLAGLLLMGSCDKDLTGVDTPDFKVTTSKATYAVGEKVQFDIEGNADQISFYSGETLKEYGYKDGRVVDATGEGVTLSFRDALTGTGGSQGTPSTTVPPQLSVLASTNYNGNYDFASTQSATWTDITSRFNYATSATFVSTAKVDVTDLMVPGKPLYIAYKYVTKPQAINGIARNWWIETVSLASKKNIGTTAKPIYPEVYNMQSMGFQLIDQNPVTAPARSVITTTRISLYGNLYDAVNEPGNDPQSENWVVSRPIYESAINSIDLGPDLSTALKDYAALGLKKSHVYTYSQAGTYTATFVGTNNNMDHAKHTIKQIELTVTP